MTSGRRYFYKPPGAHLLVIDTLAAVTAGGDENTSQVMSAVIDCAKQIIAGCGAHVLIVHHQAKGNDQARGHSSLRAGVDTEIHVTSSMPGFGKCKVTKQRDLELSPAFGFQVETVTLGVNRRGREVTSCVVKPTELQGEAVELSRDEQVLKTIVDNIIVGRNPQPITIKHSGGAVRCSAVIMCRGTSWWRILSVTPSTRHGQKSRSGTPLARHGSVCPTNLGQKMGRRKDRCNFR